MTTSMDPRSTIGLSLPNRAVLFGMIDLSELVRSAELAEESGVVDSVWVGDNFLSKPRLEAISLLSFLAARTSTVRLGTVCLATFPLRHPIPLAIQWATLDVLSGGRTILAVCNGVSASDGPRYRRELENMGVASGERVGRLEEGIELLRRFWTEDEVDHAGRFYRFEGVTIEPKPMQARVPIILAANPDPTADAQTVERILRRVARLADGWQTALFAPEAFRERWERIREYAAEYDRADQLTHSSTHIMVNINDDQAVARRESIEFLDRYYGLGYILQDQIATWLLAGSAAKVTDGIAAFIDAGCTTPIVRFTSADQLGQLERFVVDVAPQLASTTVR